MDEAAQDARVQASGGFVNRDDAPQVEISFRLVIQDFIFGVKQRKLLRITVPLDFPVEGDPLPLAQDRLQIITAEPLANQRALGVVRRADLE